MEVEYELEVIGSNGIMGEWGCGCTYTFFLAHGFFFCFLYWVIVLVRISTTFPSLYQTFFHAHYCSRSGNPCKGTYRHHSRI